MNRAVKRLGLGILILLGLLLATAIALPFLIDLNDYKDEIAQAAADATGRQLTIKGDIKLSIFPWLGVEMGQTQLGNAAGFGPEPFAKLDSIQVRVKLLPLLKQQVEADRIVINGLQLHLARQRNGRSNWDDLVQQEAETDTEPQTSSPPASTKALAILALGGIEIRDSSLTWDDKLTKQHWRVQPLNLQSGAIAWGQTFPLALELTAEGKHLQARAQIELKTQVTLHRDKRAQLTHLAITTQLWHPQLPRAPLRLETTLARGEVDWQQQQVKLNKLVLKQNTLRLQADIAAQKILQAPAYEGKISIPAFALRTWLAELGVSLPKTVPATALTKAEARLKLKGNITQLDIPSLQIRVDQSQLSGSAALPGFDPLKVRYQLALDQIDLDAYQAPAAKKSTAVVVTPAAGAAAATQLPMALLRGLDIDGGLSVGKLKTANLKLADIDTHLLARQGKLRLHPLTAKLYNGDYTGDLRLNAQGKHPVVAMDERLRGVTLGPLFKDLIGDDKLHGATELHAKLKTEGADVESMRQHLSGQLDLSLKDGYVKGIDIDYAERKIKAILDQQPKPPKPDTPQTGFSRLEARFKIDKGIARGQTLSAQLPHARMQGMGTVDLVHEQLDMTLNLKFTSKVAGQAGRRYEELDKVPVPVHVRGPWQQPQFEIDYDVVVKALLKQELKKKEAEAKAKLKQKAEEEKQQLKKELEQKLKDKADDLLKKLFKR